LVVPARTVNESEVGLTAICGALADPVIVIVKFADAVWPHESVASSVKLNVPESVGVPARDRDKSVFVWIIRPFGSDPLVSVKAGDGENGFTQPPLVVSN